MRTALSAALPLLAAATASLADPAPRLVQIRLFHASAPALEAAGVPLAALIAAGDPRHWDVRALDAEQGRALLATLSASKSVHELAIPGAAEGVAVTRESPWQLDGSVEIAVAAGASGPASIERAELPLRLACWIERDGPSAPVQLEALIPTGHARADDTMPLATRVELSLGDQPVAAVAVACSGGACEANVLVARIGGSQPE